MSNSQPPYLGLETDPRWKAVQAALRDPVENRDIELRTAPEYVIGYLVQRIRQAEADR